MKALSFPFQLSVDGSLASTTDYAQVVRGQLIDALMTNLGERKMRPRHGCDIQSALFDPSQELERSDAAALLKGRLQSLVPRAMVKSVTTTSMVLRLGEIYGVPVHETGVGFKYLGPKMRETDALIAGEESGGFAFRGHLPERDGILSGLYILDLMAQRGKDLPALVEELFAKVGPHYYDRIDITMTDAERDRIAAALPQMNPASLAGLRVTGYDRTDGLRFLLEDGAWALIRLSGTEPLMRVYTEVRDKSQVQPVLQAVRELTGA